MFDKFKLIDGEEYYRTPYVKKSRKNSEITNDSTVPIPDVEDIKLRDEGEKKPDKQ